MRRRQHLSQASFSELGHSAWGPLQCYNTLYIYIFYIYLYSYILFSKSVRQDALNFQGVADNTCGTVSVDFVKLVHDGLGSLSTCTWKPKTKPHPNSLLDVFLSILKGTDWSWLLCFFRALLCSKEMLAMFSKALFFITIETQPFCPSVYRSRLSLNLPRFTWSAECLYWDLAAEQDHASDLGT